ncbi:Myb-like dna-binding protein, partial [Globisporangium splendens]
MPVLAIRKMATRPGLVSPPGLLSVNAAAEHVAFLNNKHRLVMNTGIWSEEEHDRFLYAIKKYPQGPWSTIADFVGTRSARQVQTHTQKYYEKILRRMRGLRRDRKTWARLEHRIEDDILEFCKSMNGPRIAAEIENQLAGTPDNSQSNSRATSPTQAANSSSSANQTNQSLASQIDLGLLEALEVDETNEAENDDDAFFGLPSLEESLDFFIASLEFDTQQ